MSNFNQAQDELIAGNGFFAIPIRIMKEGSFSASEVLVLSSILSLSTQKGYCYATNAALAELGRCSVRNINLILSKWKSRGWISTIVDIDQATKKVLSRKIYIQSARLLDDLRLESLQTPHEISSPPHELSAVPPCNHFMTPMNSFHDPHELSAQVIDNIINKPIKNLIDISQPAVVPQTKAKGSIFNIKDSITKEQYQTILTDPTLCDNDRTYLYECAREMEDWSKAGLKKKIDWAAALRNWVRGNRRKGNGPNAHSKAASGPKTFKQLDEEREALEWAQTQARMKEKFGEK